MEMNARMPKKSVDSKQSVSKTDVDTMIYHREGNHQGLENKIIRADLPSSQRAAPSTVGRELAAFCVIIIAKPHECELFEFFA
jgi:hypothetical protein